MLHSEFADGNGNGHNRKSNAPVSGVSRLDKLHPQNVEAEQAVLGAAFIDNATMADLAVKLRPEDFYRLTHRYIFESMLFLYERREPIDYVTVAEALDRIRAARNLERLEVEIGIDYLAEIAERVPTAANALFYAAQVRHKAALRELITATDVINRESFEYAGDLAEFFDSVEQRIFAITQRDVTREVLTMRGVLHEVFARLDEYQDRAGQLTGIPSGFSELDELTGGFQDEELIVLAARPSMGKTSLALSIARYVGIRERVPLAFFSCEMARGQIAQNMLCAESRLDTRRVRAGRLDEFEYGKLVEAAGRMAESPIFIDDTPAIGLRELSAKTRRLATRHGVRAVIVDYLQLMGKPLGASRHVSREEQVGMNTRGLKALARELKLPVIVLAQLNRDAEKRATSRPRLSDLRESGEIEQSADVVGLLHRDYYYTREAADARKAELILAKQRNGPTGTANLVFLQEFVRFDNPDDEFGDASPRRHVTPTTNALPGLPNVATVGALPPDVASLAGTEPDDDFSGAPFDYDGDDVPPVF